MGVTTNPTNKQGNNMLSVVIGNDIKDVDKITAVINKLETTRISHEDIVIEEAIDWLKDIYMILTDKNFGQELYDPSELAN